MGAFCSKTPPPRAHEETEDEEVEARARIIRDFVAAGQQDAKTIEKLKAELAAAGGAPEDLVSGARARLLAALGEAEAAAPDAVDEAQAEVLERAAQLALAIVEAPGELPAAGTFTEAESLFAALRPRPDGGLTPVRLLRSSWIKARAAKINAAATDGERRRWALPRRQDLERDEPTAFMDVDELEALPRNGFTGSLALGASSYCWLVRRSLDRPTALRFALIPSACCVRRPRSTPTRSASSW